VTASKRIFTIGHSTRPIGEFVALLRAHGVRLVADVRTVPRSRHNPQFDQAALKDSLRRRRTRNDSPNTGWRNASFRGYADHMQTPEFADGLEELEALARKRTAAVMCAEAVPWCCHRSLIADALLVGGWKVADIQSETRAIPHKRMPFLRVRNGALSYPGTV
jgi:uncharacterized protein (DUF488 family)